MWGPFFSGFDRTATVDSIQKGNIRKEKQGGFRSENIFSVLLRSPISRNDSVGEKKKKREKGNDVSIPLLCSIAAPMLGTWQGQTAAGGPSSKVEGDELHQKSQTVGRQFKEQVKADRAVHIEEKVPRSAE